MLSARGSKGGPDPERPMVSSLGPLAKGLGMGITGVGVRVGFSLCLMGTPRCL